MTGCSPESYAIYLSKMGSKLIGSVLFLALFGLAVCAEEQQYFSKTRNRRKLEIVTSTNETNPDAIEPKQIESNINTVDRVETYRNNYHQTPIRNPFGVKIYSSRKSSSGRYESTRRVNLTEPYRLAAQSELNRIKFKEKEDNVRDKDMAPADSTNAKTNKETAGKDEDEEEKTLAQQVADGKYGLIQNEIFANGSKRPGILSYLSNSEVPKDTKENLGGLEKDEIWLAEDHILVLRGGKYGEGRENNSSPVWAPIDDYTAPNRQVKIPKNPKVPPPFPVQLTDDGPLQFIKGQVEPNINPQLIFPFPFPPNKSLPFPYAVPPPPNAFGKNQSIVLPLPPVPLPPFLGNFPPGATFLIPPPNMTDVDEDDPSIYYPPKYDFYYPQANNSPVPAGPLVPGIILPPPPDFFAPLENDTLDTSGDKNETDISLNQITRSPFAGPKYLPVENKSTKLKAVNNRNFKRPFSKESEVTQLPKTPTSTEPKKPLVAYVFPENSKPELSFNSLRTKNTNLKVPVEENVKIFNPPSKERPIYHPLPTTSPKPNHITVPTTLSKDIYIVTTPEAEQNKIEDIYKNAKPRKPVVYENISPELHPLRSLIRPNVSVSYTGKYGHLPASTPKPFPAPDGKKHPQISLTGHYITQPPPDITQNTITSTPDVNVTPVPIVKKIRIRPILPEKTNPSLSTVSPSKATFYFYEEPSKTEAPKEIIQLIETTKQATPNKLETNNEITPVTQYYSVPVSTGKTPVRQFLEETFHASNLFQPHDPRINNAEAPGDFPGKSKVKQLQYENNVSPKPILKYHYVTEVPPIIIPSPKINALEIQNSGSTGLQKVNLDKGHVRNPPKPFYMPEIFSSPKPPEKLVTPTTPIFTPVKPTIPAPTPDVNDTPFIPSNYYATSRPEHIHFTAQEQTLVDDITKNYFTIFGQKIQGGSTTPLTPVKPTKPKPPANVGKNVQIIAEEPATNLQSHNKTKVVNVPTPPPSHFEQYLKEITGEDQRDYIVTGVQGKVKKGKGFLPFAALPGVFPTPLYPAKSIPLQAFRVEPPLQPYPPGLVNVRKLIYPPTYSTTLRPVVDVEINPQYIQQITPGPVPRPFPVVQPTVQKVPLAHNLGQYLQEITNYNGPTTANPVKGKNRPTRLLVSPSGAPIKDIEIRNPSSPTVGITDRPISLESDIIINFKHPLPPVNRDAEPIDIKAIKENSYRGGSNIKVVDSPDLTKEQNILLQSQKNNFESAKHFFQNLPNSGYFSPSHQPTSNSFVSYNLPGNGGHFYFLTPQILENPNEPRIQSRGSKFHAPQIPGRQTQSASQHKNNYRRNYSTDLGHSLTNGYSNHDYLRRRRKKS
ncbi:UNVERIFIED_CONTAM: hypothetical protein PYX00_005940 [Menopon gallinae]|uniref:Proline-rich extensin-like protein EPR1 n=1 Tax=Menopon gallinae TaxID=328185 RepID=A0AAW2HUG9_9NEOP